VAHFLTYPDPKLYLIALSRPVDKTMIAVGDRLLAAATSAQAYGLAAIHIGELEPLIVIRNDPNTSGKLYLVYFNPVVTHLTDQRTPGLEGSVSLPGVEVQIVRSLTVALAYDDAQGDRHSIKLEDVKARIAQHETDQVNGIFFLDRLSRLKKDMALRKFHKLGQR
jgi:peptide deformylase